MTESNAIAQFDGGPRGLGSSKIVRIDLFEVACTLPERVGNARGFFENRGSLLVRVMTAGGVSGWGETWAFPSAAAALIRTDLGRSCLERASLGRVRYTI